VCVCVCVLRGSRVHDAGGDGAAAGAPVVVVHPQVVTELMSHDGGERGKVVVGELRRRERARAEFTNFSTSPECIIIY